MEELDKSLKAVAKGAGIIFAGMIIGKVLTTVNTILLARVLGPSNYGLFSLGLSVVEILAIIGAFGLTSAVTRFIPAHLANNRDDKVKYIIRFSLKFSLVLSVILATILFLSSEPISAHIFKDESLSIVLKILTIALPIYTINRILPSIFRGLGNAKYRVITQDIMLVAIKIAAFIVFIYLGYLLNGALAAFIIGTVLTLMISLYVVHKKLFPFLGFDLNTKDTPVRRELLSFSWPLVIGNFSYIFYTHTDRLFLGFFKTSKDIGVYMAGSQIAHLLTFVLPSLAFIFLPIMSELYSKNKMHDFAHLYKSITRWVFLITLPLFLFLVFFSKEIILLLFGLQYWSSVNILRILALAFFISASVGLAWDTLLAMGKSKALMMTQSVGAMTNVVLNVLLIPPFGIEGAAIGTASGIIIVNFMQLYIIYHSKIMLPFDKNYLKVSLIAILIMLSIITAIHIFPKPITYWLVLVIFPIYFALYITILTKSHCLQQEDMVIVKLFKDSLKILFKRL